MTTTQDQALEGLGTYKFGWADSDVAGAAASRGLSEAKVREISALKNEPEWMLDFRLKGLRLFELSAAGHAAGPTSYDDVAVSALRYLRETAGEDAVEDFARRRIAQWESRYAAKIASLPLDERPAALAQALCDDGYAATVHDGGVGVQVCQHHCPVQHVAEEFPALCDAETEAIGRLVGRHVQRLATIAHGDGVCTTHIPLIPVTPVTSGRTSS